MTRRSAVGRPGIVAAVGGKRSGKQSNNRHRDFIFIRKNHDATLSTGNAKFYVEQLRELLQTVPHRGM